MSEANVAFSGIERNFAYPFGLLCYGQNNGVICLHFIHIFFEFALDFSFADWQRKLREAACTELSKNELEPENSLIPSGWARLEAAEPAPAEAGVRIDVGGYRVTATTGTDHELLAKVCRMLKAL